MNHPSRALCITALLLSGCAPATVDLVAESHKLLQRDAEWSQVASAGSDLEKIVSYWSDDAVVIPQGQPIAEGKAAIRSFVDGALKTPGFKVQWVADSVALSPDGKMGYIRETTTTTVTGPNGAPLSMVTRAITVWRKEADGEWRCVVDIWNDPPTAPAS